MEGYRTRTKSGIRIMDSRLGLMFVIGYLSIISAAADPGPDINSVLHQILGDTSSEDGDGGVFGSLVGSPWGIPDMSATVGRLFQYNIPKELFGEHSVGIDTDSLPDWLNFDHIASSLEGVPDEEHVGREFFLQVVSHGEDGHAHDTFSIKVVEDSPHTDTTPTPLAATQSSEGLQRIRCPVKSSVTMATVIVDVDLKELKPGDKSGLMRRIGEHLEMPVELLRLLPVGNRPMIDSSALVAGPGDVKQAQKPGAILQWEVGCGNVQAPHMPILQQLETTSHSGSMGQAVGHGIIGWHVTNNKPAAPHRMKRQVKIRPTATAVPSAAPPTQRPGVTTEVDEGKTDMTRVVPSQASPTFIKPTATKKTKHRSKTGGRHTHKTKKRKDKKKTRKHKKHKETAVVTPTATRISPTPTRVVQPTSEVKPPMPEPEPTPTTTQSIDVIEPSMKPTKVAPRP